MVAWDAAPCKAEGEIAENVEWAWLFFAFLSATNILLSLPMQVPLSGHLMHCSQFIISLDISSQGVLHWVVFSTYT